MPPAKSAHCYSLNPDLPCMHPFLAQTLDLYAGYSTTKSKRSEYGRLHKQKSLSGERSTFWKQAWASVHTCNFEGDGLASQKVLQLRQCLSVPDDVWCSEWHYCGMGANWVSVCQSTTHCQRFRP